MCLEHSGGIMGYGNWWLTPPIKQFYTSILSGRWPMQFRIVAGEPCVPGQLGYSSEDHSFIFRSESLPPAVTTLQINTLQLSVNEEGQVLYVWGYCPLFRFQATAMLPPQSTQGHLV